MPRKTKEIDIEPILNTNKSSKKTSKSGKVTRSQAKPKDSVKNNKSKSATKVSKVKSATKSTSKTTKKSTVKKVAKSTTKKVSAKTSKSTVSSSKASKSKNEIAINFSPEYYDLPFRYNKTVVKILAQTPKNLFIYWEISDADRESLKKQYGNYFFEITKPVLIVHNETMNYSFEVDVDDFANSWYLPIDDSNSEYKVELGRRPIPINYNYMPTYDIEKNGPIEPVNIPYIYISSSNELESPNDRILFNNTDKIYFRNVKTNELIVRDIKDFKKIYQNGKFVNIHEIYHHLYQDLYKGEIINDNFDLNNPSSGNPSSGSFSSKFI